MKRSATYSLAKLSWCACLLLLTACKTFPPLPAETAYVVQKIGASNFLIYYQDDHTLSEERVVDFALLRACHAVEENGFDYFAVVNPGRPAVQNEIIDTDALYEDLVDGLVVKGFKSRPKRIFVFKSSTLMRMIHDKLAASGEQARL